MARATAAQKAEALAVVAKNLGVDPDALAALVAQKPVAEATAKVSLAKPVPAPKFADVLETGITDAGFSFAKGRTYVSKALVEAQARALNKKAAGFEIVKSAVENAHTAAIVVVRDEQGRVFSQNLTSKS